MLALRARQDLHEIALELGVAQLAELDGHEIAVHAQHRRDAHGQVDVRAVLLQAELQEGIDTGQRVNSLTSAPHPWRRAPAAGRVASQNT